MPYCCRMDCLSTSSGSIRPASDSDLSAAAVAACREPISSKTTRGAGSDGPKLMSTRSSTMCWVATSAICWARVCSDRVKKSAKVVPSAHEPVWVPRFRKCASTARAICSSW
jgi:hypothetical protein